MIGGNGGGDGGGDGVVVVSAKSIAAAHRFTFNVNFESTKASLKQRTLHMVKR